MSFSSSSYSYSSLDRANTNVNAHIPQEQEQEQALSFSLDDILLLLEPSTNTNTRTDTMSMSMSTPTQSLAPPPPRSRTASLSHSASLARQTNPPPALRPDSVLYSSPSWAQTMPLPKLHDPLPTALPARASVMAQLPPAMRQLGFLGNRAGAGNRESLSSDDDANQDQVYTLDDTPEFRSTISLLEPEGTSSGDSDEFAVLNLDASFHDDIHLMFDADPVDHDGDVDAETHDRSAASSSDATLVHATTAPSIEHADPQPGARHEGLSLAPMQPPSDEQLARGRQPAPKSTATGPGANRVSVVGDLPTFPRKGSHQHHRHAPPLPSTNQVASPPTPTRQEVHGAAAVGGGTIFGKLKRALSARRTSPHSPTPPPHGRIADSDASPASTPSHQRSNSIDQGIDTLRRALSRATSARRRKSPEDPPIPAPSSMAPNPYHNATAAVAQHQQHQQQHQQQEYQVSPYGTIVYDNHDNYHAGHTDYDQQHHQQQQQQFFSPPAESTLGGLGLGGGGDELYMATMARGDAESDRSLDHASQEVSTNPFATLAGLPLTVPTRSESRRMSSGAYLLGVPSGAGTGAGTDMANTPPDMHEPVPAVFTLARPSAGAPPLTPTRVEEHGTGYMTMQHTGAGAAAAAGAGAGGATDMLAQAREVAGYQTMRRGGR